MPSVHFVPNTLLTTQPPDLTLLQGEHLPNLINIKTIDTVDHLEIPSLGPINTHW